MKKSIKTKIKQYQIRNYQLSGKSLMFIAADCPETAVFYWLQKILEIGPKDLKYLRQFIDINEYFEIEELEENLRLNDNKEYFSIDILHTYDYPWVDTIWYEMNVEGLNRLPSRRIMVIEARDD